MRNGHPLLYTFIINQAFSLTWHQRMLVLLLCFLTFASPFVSYVPSVAFSAPGGKNNLCSAAAHYTGANERQRIMFVQRDEGANAPS